MPITPLTYRLDCILHASTGRSHLSLYPPYALFSFGLSLLVSMFDKSTETMLFSATKLYCSIVISIYNFQNSITLKLVILFINLFYFLFKKYKLIKCNPVLYNFFLY